MAIADRLTELGIALPKLPDPKGNYVHAKQVGDMLYLSGKGPASKKGKLGVDVTVDEGYRCAREVGLVLVAAMSEALGGDLDRVKEVVKVFGMVNADPEFGEHPKVINGCSDLFVEIFGERGRHARSAVGMGSLPNRIPVEIEVIVALTSTGR